MALTGGGTNAGFTHPAFLYTLLLFSLGFLVSGLLLPAMSIVSFGFYETRYSLLQGVLTFFEDGQLALGLFVVSVSVVFPITKISLGFYALWARRPGTVMSKRALSALVWLSKWSLTDVFVLALAVLVIDGRLLTSADLHIGVALFAAGVVLSSVTISLIRRQLRPV